MAGVNSSRRSLCNHVKLMRFGVYYTRLGSSTALNCTWYLYLSAYLSVLEYL